MKLTKNQVEELVKAITSLESSHTHKFVKRENEPIYRCDYCKTSNNFFDGLSKAADIIKAFGSEE